MKNFLLKLLYLYIFISSLWSSIFYLNQPIGNSFKIENNSFSENLKGLSFDYAHTLFESDTSKYSFLIGISKTIKPYLYQHNNQSLSTNMNVRFIYMMIRSKYNDKLSSWFSIGATSINIDYLKLHLPYSYYRYINEQGDCLQNICIEYDADNPSVCLEYVCTQYEYINYFEETPAYNNNEEPFEFSDMDSFGNIGIQFGIDYKVNNMFSVGFSHFFHKIQNFLAYDQSVYQYNKMDLNVHITNVRFGIHF